MLFLPQFVARVNYTPLLKAEELERLRPERVLKRLRREILRQIKAEIMKAAFTTAARKRLLKGFKVTVGEKSIKVEAIDPAFKPLLGGQKSEQMTWLTKARKPIPIILDNGNVIFRSATPRSMKNGSWYHPGRQAHTVIEKARKAAREVMRKRLRQELSKQLRAAIERAGVGA